MRRRIYVASSWDNPQQPAVVEELRRRGHTVSDFRHPHARDDCNVWDMLNVNRDEVTGEMLADLLDEPVVYERYREQLEAMRDADLCLLLLPSGRSAHIEAGYMKGLGKTVYVFGSVFDRLRPELMYLAFDAFFPLYETLFKVLEDDDGE